MDKQKLTNSELRKIAENFRYVEVRGQFCHKQLIFTNRKHFISYDIDSHNGGVWKKAGNIRNLGSKERRLGTYAEDTTTRIGN